MVNCSLWFGKDLKYLWVLHEWRLKWGVRSTEGLEQRQHWTIVVKREPSRKAKLSIYPLLKGLFNLAEWVSSVGRTPRGSSEYSRCSFKLEWASWGNLESKSKIFMWSRTSAALWTAIVLNALWHLILTIQLVELWVLLRHLPEMYVCYLATTESSHIRELWLWLFCLPSKATADETMMKWISTVCTCELLYAFFFPYHESRLWLDSDWLLPSAESEWRLNALCSPSLSLDNLLKVCPTLLQVCHSTSFKVSSADFSYMS